MTGAGTSASRPTATWRISSYCANGSCVEVRLARPVQVRDGKDRSGPILVFARAEWTSFIASLKRGEYDPTRQGTSSDCQATNG